MYLTPEEISRFSKSSGDLHEGYVTLAEERGDLIVRPEHVKNPRAYRPILWSLEGRPEPTENPQRSRNSTENANPTSSSGLEGTTRTIGSTKNSSNPMLSSNPFLSEATPTPPISEIVSSNNPLLAVTPTPPKTDEMQMSTDVPATSSTPTTTIFDTNAPPAKKVKRENHRGQNKDRSANVKQVNDTAANMICGQMALHGTCPFGDSCKQGHDLVKAKQARGELVELPIRRVDSDLSAYLTASPGDYEICKRYHNVTKDHGISIIAKVVENAMEEVPLSCPFESHTYCPYGVNCKLGDHTDDQGNNLTKDGQLVTAQVTLEQPLPPSYSGMNDSTSSFKSSLKNRRTKQNAWPLSSKFLTSYKKETQFAGHTQDAPLTDEYLEEWTTLTNEMAAIRVNVGLPEGPAERPAKADVLKGKLVLAPLTTVGNLPFRRLCCHLGADVTVSEMAVARSLLEGNKGEHALLKRHPDEKVFGIQLAGGYPDEMIKAAEMLEMGMLNADGERTPFSFDFVDINMGCPLEPLHKRFGGGSILMTRKAQQEVIIRGMTSILSCPLSVKFRNDHFKKDGQNAHKLVSKFERWGARALIHHGRSAKARYTGLANWQYIHQSSNHVSERSIPYIGNGDIYSPFDSVLNRQLWASGPESDDVEPYHGGMMIGRGALIKPWIFSELKENRVWDISSSQRFEYLKRYCSYGLSHWGSDAKGVESTRRFLLEAQSFLHRYTPVGLLERQPAHIQGRPPPIIGRDDLETLMASPSVDSWINITEMLLGKVPDGFSFIPKHRSSSYNADN